MVRSTWSSAEISRYFMAVAAIACLLVAVGFDTARL